MSENRLVRNLKRLISNFVTSYTGKQIHTLPDISRSKNNRTMETRQLTEHNVKITSLEK